MYKYKPLITIILAAILLAAQPVFAITPETQKGIDYDATFWSGVSSPCGTSSGGSSSGSGGGGTATKSIASFVDTYGKMAYDNSIKTGIPYDFTLGQAILESGYGQSGLTKQANNFFGIKGKYNGQSIMMRTREETSSGGSYYVMAEFRKYPSPQDSFNDHDRLFRTAPRYAEALKYPNDPIMFLTEVKKAGYATAGNYIQVVGDVIRGVQAYVASKNLYPPSSQVVYQIEPIPGASTSTGSSTATSAGNCSTAQQGDVSNYKNPLRDTTGLQSTGIGSGVTYGGSGKMYAVGKGKVVLSLTNAENPESNFVSYKLTEGPATNKIIYVSGMCASKVRKDQEIDANTVLCEMKNEDPFTQIGWANDTGIGPAETVANDQFSAYGVNFSQLLAKLGLSVASTGDSQATDVTLPTGWPTWQ